VRPPRVERALGATSTILADEERDLAVE